MKWSQHQYPDPFWHAAEAFKFASFNNHAIHSNLPSEVQMIEREEIITSADTGLPNNFGNF